MYFKILREGRSCNGGVYTWSLPQENIPGEWSEYIKGKLTPCRVGYHLAEDHDLFRWIGSKSHIELYVAETKFRVFRHNNKSVAHQVRLVAKVILTRENYLKILDEVYQYYVESLRTDYYSFKVEKSYEILKTSRRFSNIALLAAFFHYVNSRIYSNPVERKFSEFFYASFYRHCELSKYELSKKGA